MEEWVDGEELVEVLRGRFLRGIGAKRGVEEVGLVIMKL
jgi:hypothetical protein